MKVSEAISRADMLYPNLYSRKEKLGWCSELTAMIFAEYKKTFDVVELEGEGARLPPEILIEDIEGLWVDGRRLQKADDRSFDDIVFDGKIKIVCRVRPEPYCEEEYRGRFVFRNVKLSEFAPGTAVGNPEPEYGAVGVPEDSVFRAHDLMRIARGEKVEERRVMEVRGGECYFSGEQDLGWYLL